MIFCRYFRTASSAGLVLVLILTLGCSNDERTIEEVGAAMLDRLPSSDRMAFVTHRQQGLELARSYEAPRALAEFERCLAITRVVCDELVTHVDNGRDGKPQ